MAAASQGSGAMDAPSDSLSMLLEFTDAMALDIPALNASPVAQEDVMAFSAAPEVPKRLSPVAAEEKRVKERLKERRKYYRKKGMIEGLRNEVAALEKQLKALTTQLDANAELEDKPSPSELENDPEARRKELQKRTVELLQTKTRLRNVNTQLQRQFHEAELRAAYLSDLLYAEHKLYRAHSSHFRLLTPLSPQTCFAIHDRAIEVVRAFEATTMSAPQVCEVAGWGAKRVVDGLLFKFAMQKTFPRSTAKFVCSRMWTLLTDPVRNRKLYSEVLDVEVRLVQKVDDDNFVFLEEMRSMDPDESGESGQMVKSALLMSRFKVSDSGFRIHMRALDKREIELEDRVTGEAVALPHELWTPSEQLTWIEFQDVGVDSSRVTYAGMTPTIGANAFFWMAEVVMVCLRSEQALFHPRFSVT